MIQLNGLYKSYGRQVVFEDVSFVVNKGERIGLTCRNGSGKTTLFRLIVKDEKPDAGSINISKGYWLYESAYLIRRRYGFKRGFIEHTSF